jgi:hypothetical protein
MPSRRQLTPSLGIKKIYTTTKIQITEFGKEQNMKIAVSAANGQLGTEIVRATIALIPKKMC